MMMTRQFWLMTLLSTIILAGCTSKQPLLLPTSTPQSFTNPVAYCAAVGTIDQPDARYTGESVPDVVIQTLMNVFNAPADVPPEIYADPQRSFWRCMDHKVYACNVGANLNLPCMSKANTDRTPTAALETYCQENPNADVVPMVVTGHDTIYAWKCQGSTPIISEQIAQTDAQGFLANIWYEVTPSDSSSSER
jgi:predicted small lipoprotein YifL